MSAKANLGDDYFAKPYVGVPGKDVLKAFANRDSAPKKAKGSKNTEKEDQD
jgi:hypothetical protein